MSKTSYSFLALVALLGAGLAACSHTATNEAVPGSVVEAMMTPLQPNKVVYSRIDGTDPLSIVHAYNTALLNHEINRALSYLAYAVVFVEQTGAPCIQQVISGQQVVEAYLRHPGVLSRWAGDYHVDGKRVTYRLREWLDPRIVGPTYPQPRETRVVAVVENGEIVSALLERESPWVNKYGERGITHFAVSCGLLVP